MKNIIWVGADNLHTVEILEDVEDYLNGLDNIVIGQDDQRVTYCKEPKYGYLIIAINMMMGDASDEQLFQELMTFDDDDDRNRVRRKMLQCFEGIGVHGFPRLNLPPDAHGIDYPYLDDKFRNGLQIVVNSILERVSSPR